MKLLGIIGGMSWTSTAEYYRLLNGEVARQRGGLHSARLLIHSVDFAQIAALQTSGQWHEAGELLAEVARGLERAGADGVLLATNTMHKVAPQIEAAISLPFFHIADSVGRRLQEAGVKRAGLLGTAFTMEQDFYKDRLHQQYGLEVLVPDEAGRADVHRIIFDELCQNLITDESRQIYRRQMAELVGRGAQAIILGCTEITLLVGAGDVSVPVFDTSAIHVEDAARFMLG
ncbi:aspartate/glutamate racemase family protein [Deinococcus psychrotolerans]|uniref:Aspartate/glutamate racemase family protein n=1 Tax=Deinococcus psychrotolerans TaxID=2489213 RepID=A0A3G8Y908_9DEIO|nr:aspartate/glutamate racemase family protein [Deinococcus psychrotolerans]AZI41393.1 aspartate/glutamate racemase family protein [Deinococcus psychrotolerans]